MSDLTFTAAAAATTSILVTVAQVTPEVLGVPIGILLAAHAGALFGLSQTPPEKWGRALAIPSGQKGARRAWGAAYRGAGVLFTVMANAFLMSWVMVFMPYLFDSLKAAPLAAGAGILAFGGQHLIPRLFKAAGDRVESWGGKKP